MSELGQCNFCKLETLKRQARARKEIVHILPEPYGFFFPKGVGVYAVPRGRKLVTSKTGGGRNKNFRFWAAEIGTECTC